MKQLSLLPGKKYRVQRRFAYWVEKTIQADDFDQAVQIAKSLKGYQVLYPTDEDVGVIHVEELPGLAVSEEF